MDLSAALATFIDECQDLLAQMEQILLQADSGHCSDDEMNALFRAAHTIKGSAGLFGLDELVRFTHVVENILDQLRNRSMQFSPELVSLLLASQDHISAQVAAVADSRPLPLDEQLLADLRAYQGGSATAVVEQAKGAEPVVVTTRQAVGPEHWHLSLRFGADVLRMGMDPLTFIRYLSTIGTLVHVETITDHLPAVDSYDAESCYLGFEVALQAESSKEELEAVFEFVRDDAQITILPPKSKAEDFIKLIQSLPEGGTRLGEILVSCGSVTAHELAHALQVQEEGQGSRRLGEILVSEGAVHAPVIDAALDKQRKGDEKRQIESRSVKVAADRLDALIDRVGELVIATAAMALRAQQTHQVAMVEAANGVQTLVEDIRESALRLRMVPIGEVFSRFPRVVRDLSKELGKEIELRISGAEAELDKTMVDRVADPLMHLLRNAIDHGIEAPELRMTAGKPAKGVIALNAYHESGSIVIEVADDGGGLKRDKILKKAIERGLIAADAQLSDSDVFRLILEPGFSTADAVTNLSGRGVGMDVVKSNIEALRGSLDISSEPGQGTTIRLYLPLTLAIIDGFQVVAGHNHYIIPLDQVVECIELPEQGNSSDYLNLRGEVLPFVRLRQLFSIAGDVPSRQNVVVRAGTTKAGLAVDRLAGECQTVIKPLGRLFSQVPGIAGSTIMGTGDVALIVDVPQLVQFAVQRDHQLLRGRGGSPLVTS